MPNCRCQSLTETNADQQCMIIVNPCQPYMQLQTANVSPYKLIHILKYYYSNTTRDLNVNMTANLWEILYKQ